MSDLISERETGCQNSFFSSLEDVSSSSSSSSYLVFGLKLEVFGLFSDLRLILGSEKLNEYKIHTIARISKMMINAFVATDFHQNISCNKAINGQEIYPPSFSYFVTSQSIIGKLITAEMMIITMINCLIRSFIRYPLAMIAIPTKKHNAKKTYSPTSPNAMLAYVLRNVSTGEPPAK